MVVVTGVDLYRGGFLEDDVLESLFIAILAAGDIVDLRLLRVLAKQRSVGAGEKLRLVARAKNRSAFPSVATTVDFYLSPDPKTGGDPRWIGAVDLPGMAARKGKTVRLEVNVPPDLTPGNYLLVASVDEEKSNYDPSRANNLLVAKRPIEIR